jgi:hypothetical protein
MIAPDLCAWLRYHEGVCRRQATNFLDLPSNADTIHHWKTEADNYARAAELVGRAEGQWREAAGSVKP